MKKEKAQPPVWEGEPVVIEGHLRLRQQTNGPLKLWFKPGLDDGPPSGRFALAADIATGSGGPESGNSALVGGNATTTEQVLEYTDPRISETRLARLAVAICRWLHDALLIWEATGPTGKRFSNEIQEIGYGNLWLRPREDVRSHELTQKPGWVNSATRDKVDLFDAFWVAMDENRFTPRSTEMLVECGGWEWDGEKVVYRGIAHGDRVIAGGLCCKAMHELTLAGLSTQTVGSATASWGTPMWRKMQREQSRQARARELDRGDESSDLELVGSEYL
jgi:hypothetical protein